MADKVNWETAVKPLIKKYKSRKHPLDYQSIYQLMVMVVLSARSTDNLINSIAPDLFKAYPDMKALAKAKPKDLEKYISKVRGFNKKSAWLITMAQEVKDNKSIPLTMEGLVALQGIGRKSANVIMREAKVKAEGVMVDLHVVRVAQRLGIAKGEDPKQIEQQIMSKVAPRDWGEVGMAISYLGRDICRPTDPHHMECPMKDVCTYYAKATKKKKKA